LRCLIITCCLTTVNEQYCLCTPFLKPGFKVSKKGEAFY
jgi:hypothetical protein